MAKTFDALDREAAELPYTAPVWTGVNHCIAHAADNGTDDASRMDSLICLLSYPNDQVTKQVVRWFAARGVRS